MGHIPPKAGVSYPSPDRQHHPPRIPRSFFHHRWAARALKIGRNIRVTLKDAGEGVGNAKTGPLQEGELKLVKNDEAPSS